MRAQLTTEFVARLMAAGRFPLLEESWEPVLPTHAQVICASVIDAAHHFWWYPSWEDARISAAMAFGNIHLALAEDAS